MQDDGRRLLIPDSAVVLLPFAYQTIDLASFEQKVTEPTVKNGRAFIFVEQPG